MNEELLRRAVTALETIAEYYKCLSKKTEAEKQSARSEAIVRKENADKARKSKEELWRDKYGDVPMPPDEGDAFEKDVLQDFTHTAFQKDA